MEVCTLLSAILVFGCESESESGNDLTDSIQGNTDWKIYHILALQKSYGIIVAFLPVGVL